MQPPKSVFRHSLRPETAAFFPHRTPRCLSRPTFFVSAKDGIQRNLPIIYSAPERQSRFTPLQEPRGPRQLLVVGAQSMPQIPGSDRSLRDTRRCKSLSDRSNKRRRWSVLSAKRPWRPGLERQSLSLLFTTELPAAQNQTSQSRIHEGFRRGAKIAMTNTRVMDNPFSSILPWPFELKCPPE